MREDIIKYTLPVVNHGFRVIPWDGWKLRISNEELRIEMRQLNRILVENGVNYLLDKIS